MSTAVSSPPNSRWSMGANWHLLLRVGSLVAVVAAFMLAFVRGQGEALPVGLAGLVIGWLLIVWLFRGSERAFLLTLFLVSLGLRYLLAVIIDPYLITTYKGETQVGFLFQDDRAYHKVAWELTGTWLGIYPGVEKSNEYLLKNYTISLAVLYYYLGQELMIAKLLNSFLGALTPIAAFALGKELGSGIQGRSAGGRVGGIAAFGTAFFPSLVLWSILNLKDILVVLLITTTIWAAIRFSRAPGWGILLATLFSFAFIENLRLYAFYLLGWLVPLSFFVLNDSPWRRRLQIGVPFTIAMLAVVYFTNPAQWLGARYLTDKRQEALSSSREFAAGAAETGIELEDVPRVNGGWGIQMINAPRVLPYVLWAPFPWSVRGRSDIPSVAETFVWWGVEALGLLALIVYGRRNWRMLFLPVMYIAGMVAIFSLIEGNVGTIFRHRAMLVPVGVALAGLGLVWLAEGAFARRRQDAETTETRPASTVVA